MKFESLLLHADVLFGFMEANGYTSDYIRSIKTEINWLRKNGDAYDSYEDACRFRLSKTPSAEYQRHLRSRYGILKRFDIDGKYPDRRWNTPLFRKNAYYQLEYEFKEVIDRYRRFDELRKIKENTISVRVSHGSCFLLHMQELGINTLSGITEKNTMSFFTDVDGNLIRSSTYKKDISSVLGADLGELTSEARRVQAYLPCIRPRRKNIQYLQSEEAASIHDTLDAKGTDALSLRDKAIGSLLYFTGIRGCDIASLTMDSIDWDKEEIHLIQSKTGQPITIPLIPVIGNAIYDYIAEERPESCDQHIFLCSRCPFDPLKAKSMWNIASKIYKASGVRQAKGDRKGTHLFRYNAATTYIGNGISRPVVSAILGHEDPDSLDSYTFADIKHLRECAVSIEAFPIKKGVFDI